MEVTWSKIWEYIKWFWGLLSWGWVAMFIIADSVVIGIFSSCGCKAIAFALLQGVAVALIVGAYYLWQEIKGDVKNYCRKWWDKKPK